MTGLRNKSTHSSKEEMNALKQYIDLFDETRALIEAQSPALLNAVRANAREQLETAAITAVANAYKL